MSAPKPPQHQSAQRSKTAAVMSGFSVLIGALAVPGLFCCMGLGFVFPVMGLVIAILAFFHVGKGGTLSDRLLPILAIGVNGVLTITLLLSFILGPGMIMLLKSQEHDSIPPALEKYVDTEADESGESQPATPPPDAPERRDSEKAR